MSESIAEMGETLIARIRQLMTEAAEQGEAIDTEIVNDVLTYEAAKTDGKINPECTYKLYSALGTIKNKNILHNNKISSRTSRYASGCSAIIRRILPPLTIISLTFYFIYAAAFTATIYTDSASVNRKLESQRSAEAMQLATMLWDRAHVDKNAVETANWSKIELDLRLAMADFSSARTIADDVVTRAGSTYTFFSTMLFQRSTPQITQQLKDAPSHPLPPDIKYSAERIPEGYTPKMGIDKSVVFFLDRGITIPPGYDDLRSRYLQISQSYSNIFGGWLLPVTCGVLGALLASLRPMIMRCPNCSAPPSLAIDFSLIGIRITVGAIAGLVVGWFLSPNALNVGDIRALTATPFGLAFFAGYSVDALFSLLERLTKSITDDQKPQTASSPPGGAQRPVPPTNG